MTSAETAMTVLGALLVFGALVSGIARRSILSLTAVFVLAGVVLGEGGLEVLQFDATSGFVSVLATVALVVILFRDGLEVEGEMLRREWHLPLRALVLAMPITAAIVAVAVEALTDLSWTQAFLVGALLSPTDPVLSSSVVTNPRVPRLIRHSLNLESGLNDGLALPFVLFFIILASPGGDAGTEAAKLLGEAAFGAVIGIVLGQVAGRLTKVLPGDGIVRRYEGIYALGVGLLSYGLADVTFGNGLIAAFVCGISLGAAEHDIADDFVVFSENVSSILQVITFFVFGALIVATGYHESVPALIAFIAFALLLARPVAIAISFLRVKLPSEHRGFIAWFGPKGVASMLFAVLVLNSEVSQGNAIFETAAFVILVSIIAHGLTDTVGARWIERRLSR
jgi:sodium/hydrogen antiporter